MFQARAPRVWIQQLPERGSARLLAGKWHPASVSRTIDVEARKRANADAALYRAKRAAGRGSQ